MELINHQHHQQVTTPQLLNSPLGSKDFRGQALIVNAHGDGTRKAAVRPKGWLVATVNYARFLSPGRSGHSVRSQLKLTNIGREFRFGHVFCRRDNIFQQVFGNLSSRSAVAAVLPTHGSTVALFVLPIRCSVERRRR